MALILRPSGLACLLALLVLAEDAGAASKVTLVDQATQKAVTCPKALSEPRRMTSAQAAEERAWHAEFQRTHNRLPTPLEGCVKAYEILGYQVVSDRGR